ncbi:MAG: hypothetical protein ABEJ76_01205 [Halanaeroarchaeum sp.]
MSGSPSVDERLRAVERAITDEAVPVAEIDDAAALTERIGALETRVDEVAERAAETEAAVTALRGYVGEIQSVNENVERTAAAALAAVERLSEASGPPPAIARVAEPDVDVSDPTPAADPEDESESVLDRLRDLV